MAYHICLSPSSFHHGHSSLWNDAIPRFRFEYLSPKRRFSLFSSRYSQQDQFLPEFKNPSPLQPQQPQHLNVASASPSSKRQIWINPDRSKISDFQKRPLSSRYAYFEKVAEALDSCSPTEDDVSRVLNDLEDALIEQNAIGFINNMMNPVTAPLVLKYFQKKLTLDREIILYNVTLKVLRKCKDFVTAEKLFWELLQRGIQPDNITFSTIISCARQCSLPDKAVEWFEMMPNYGCDPDLVTYSSIIDAYGRLGSIDKALSLYDRSRTEKWRIDVVTFSTVIRIHVSSGNINGSLNVYEEMKALGVKPNLVIFNTLFDALGRVRKISQLNSLYKELFNNGLVPNRATYASLIRAYCKSRYGQEAIGLYKKMRENKFELGIILYNSLLALCADLGLEKDANDIFEELKTNDTVKPDCWTYSTMINIFSSTGDVVKAEGIFNEMMESKFEPDIFVLTSLIQCYGKVDRIDDVVKTFNHTLALDINPDERFCGSLLSALSKTPKEQLGLVILCLEKANAKLGGVVKLLFAETTEDVLRTEVHSLFDSITSDSKKAYFNGLIDLCVNQGHFVRACLLFEMGNYLKVYTNMQSKSSKRWSLHVRSLSHGAALTAMNMWMKDLSGAVENGDEIPAVLGINTGHGKHQQVKKGLIVLFESYLVELNAPFVESEDLVGWFLASKDEALAWLESRKLPELVTAQ